VASRLGDLVVRFSDTRQEQHVEGSLNQKSGFEIRSFDLSAGWQAFFQRAVEQVFLFLRRGFV